MPPSPRIKIVYVGGYSRSGSTLLGRVLGGAPGAVCVGETRFLWSRGLKDNVDCGCGVPFRACAFWGEVGQAAFGGWDCVDADRLGALDRATNPLRRLPFHYTPRLRPALGRDIEEYAGHLARLYRAIARVSRARVIVETSKDPAYACLLLRLPESDVRLLHLVRDSRAVAYSWTRTRRLDSAIDGAEFMPRFGVGETALKWLAWNAAFGRIARALPDYLPLTYESFVANPAHALVRIGALARHPFLPETRRLTGDEVWLGPHHIFSGNPSRSATGWVPIRLDAEWRARMPLAQRAQVTAITWRHLRRFGYPLRAPRI